MGLRDEIESYRDMDGLVAPKRTFPGQRNASGNGILYTAEYFLLLDLRGELLHPKDPADFMAVLLSCQNEPGLFNRSPVHPDQEAPDDYLGLVLASEVLRLPYAMDIWAYGDRNHFVYNNVRPGKFTWTAWFGRMPQVVAHFQWCAGFTPALWRRLWWCGAVATAGFRGKGGEDAWILSWLLTRIIEREHVGDSLERMAIKIWRWRLKRAYPGGMKGVFSRYFGPEHPIAKYWVD